ncbi:MAG: hypothetical protein IKZ74_07095, partial [Clostridiales bacterium]|nr:hypothetical protein [Clostridiales bacterium]
DKMEKERAKSFVGKTVEVLVEQAPGDGTYEGYSKEYIRVIASSEEKFVPGDIILGTVNEFRDFEIIGRDFTKKS